MAEIVKEESFEEPEKIIIRFISVGAATLKSPFVKIKETETFQVVINYLRKQLKIKPGEGLFLYINSAFAPAPDEVISNLYKCFGNEGKLLVSYSNQAAWG